MKTYAIALNIALLLFVSPVPAAQPDDASVRLFKAQESMAKTGDPRGQFNLGEMYAHGLGTAKNMDQAIQWYTKAADQGYAPAKKRLQEEVRIRVEAEKAKSRAADAAKRRSDEESIKSAKVEEARREAKKRADEEATRAAAIQADRQARMEAAKKAREEAEAAAAAQKAKRAKAVSALEAEKKRAKAASSAIQ